VTHRHALPLVVVVTIPALPGARIMPPAVGALVRACEIICAVSPRLRPPRPMLTDYAAEASQKLLLTR
jgi:hypothetical protein